MRISLFALALLVASPTFAATPSDASTALSVVTTSSDLEPTARTAARVIVRTPMVVSATFTLRAGDGRWVRSYSDRLLWDGETVLNLDVDGIPAGTYQLVVKTRIGTQTIPIVIA
ncbi:MAG: hypothetical protein AAGI52_04850 [Bacteroidota bacterium]